MLIKLISLIVLIGIWIGLTGYQYGAWLVMLAAPIISFLIAIRLKILPSKNAFRFCSIFYFIWLWKEIIMSAIAVIKIACRKNLMIQPMLEPIKSIQKSDVGIVTYANSITLTPGTVTLSAEGNMLFVHALDVNFMNDLQEGTMDRRVMEIIK